MSKAFLEIAVTPAVRAMQRGRHVEPVQNRVEQACDRFTELESAFIRARDSFFLATVSETGWPYVQHRGGPPGFLKQIDDRTLAFADYRGNHQYISAGNAAANSRACVLLLDYRRPARLKAYVHVELIAPGSDPALDRLVSDPGYKAIPEHIFRLRLQAFDWNCPRHIPTRFSEREIAESIRPLHERLRALESENARLRARLTTRGQQ